MRYLLILITFLYLAFPCAVYSAQNRVALVIGNGAYIDAFGGKNGGKNDLF